MVFDLDMDVRVAISESRDARNRRLGWRIVPEAEIRRYHNKSAFEALLATRPELGNDLNMRRLARLCYLSEIRPWALSAEPQIYKMVNELTEATAHCTKLQSCIDEGFRWFDDAYESR